MRSLFVASAIGILAAGASVAEDAPKQFEVNETIVIAAPPDKVWKVLGDVEDSSWMQNVDTTLEQGGDPASSTRTLTLKNGHTFVVSGRQHDPEHRSLAYTISDNDAKDLPASGYSATLSIQPDGADGSKVDWKATFSSHGADAANPETAVRAWMHGGLENLKSRVEKRKN